MFGIVGGAMASAYCASKGAVRQFTKTVAIDCARKGYKEGGWGLLIALCAGLFPLLSHLKARLEPERHRS